MSQENVEVVRRNYEAFAAGGIEALVPLTAPDGVVYPFPEWVEQPEYRGPDGLRALAAVWTENFDDFAFAVHEIREVGDSVVMLGETVGTIRASGVPIRQPVAAVQSDFRNGRIGVTRFFLTWEQALEAVGLSE